MPRTAWIAASLVAASLVLPSLASAAPVCEPDKLAQKYPSLVGRTIKIGADPETPPYVVRDKADFNKITGFDADLAQAVLDCAGVKHSFFLGGWSGLIPAVGAGQIDVMWDNLYYTPARAKTVDYIIYMQAGTGALTQAGNPKKIGGVPDLCGNTAAVGLGTVEEATLRKETETCVAAGKKPIDIMTYPDVASGIRLIGTKRADIMMTDLALVDSLVKDNPSLYSRAFLILTGFKVGAAVKKGDKDLTQAIADGLMALDANGTTKKIYEKATIDPALALPTAILTE